MRRVVVLVLAASMTLTLLPGLAGAESDGSSVEPWRELFSARSGLTDAERAVSEAANRLSEIDTTLAARTAELTQLEGELAEAEAELRDARQRTARANERVRRAGEELASLTAQETAHRQRIDARAADLYRGGTGNPGGALFANLLGVQDLHDLAAGRRAIEVTLTSDRDLVTATRDLVDLTAEQRAQEARLRGLLQDEERVSARALERVESLVQRQERVVAEVAAERADRAVLLRSLEDDLEQQRALVTELERAVAAIATVRWEDLQLDGPIPDWAAGLPARGIQWSPAIHQAATQVGIDPRLFAALVWSESSFHPGAVSRAGAIGLAQLMPGTARGLGVDPTDPLQNLAGGAQYLARQLANFGSVELALAAYNAGPGAVRRFEGIPPYTETQMYVLVVLRRYQSLL